jgi:hypothetical protein
MVDRLCGLVVRVPGYGSRGLGSFPVLPDFLRSSGSGMGFTQPLLGRKSCSSGLKKTENTAVGKVVGLERGPLSLVSTTEELLERKVVTPV